MSHAITVEITDNAYQALIRRSALLKRDPEQLAADVLADSLSDPLLQLAGCLDSEEVNICDGHDRAFGAERSSKRS